MIKKIIRTIICLVYSFFKLGLKKIFHHKRFKYSVYSIISPFTNLEIGKGARVYLGKMIKIRSGCKLRARKNSEIRIGKNTSLNHGCIFTAHEKIVIGDNVQFGPNVLIYDHDHDFRKKDGLKNLEYITDSVVIGDNVWVGANVVILRGTEIGDGCVVGAGSIIKGKFPNNTIIVEKKEIRILQK